MNHFNPLSPEFIKKSMLLIYVAINGKKIGAFNIKLGDESLNYNHKIVKVKKK